MECIRDEHRTRAGWAFRVPGEVGMRNVELSPTLRLVETGATGSIGGLVDPARFAGMDRSSPERGWAVYVYPGADVTPDDIDGTEVNPMKVTALKYGETGYAYRTDYLPDGQYTLAATCQADLDDPETDDLNDTTQRLTFAEPVTVTVTLGEQTPLDF